MRRIVPKNLHLKSMNPNIDLTDFPVIMPSSIIDWKGSRAVAGTSSFGFSGTNSHGTLEAPGGGEGKNVVLERPEKLKWNRTYHRMYHDWSQGFWFASEWRPAPLTGPKSQAQPCLVIGGGAFAEALRELIDCELQPAQADMAGALKSKAWKMVVFAECLVAEDPTAEGPAMAALLSAAQAAASLGALRFVVLTAGAQEADASEGIGKGLLGATAWGFMRSMPLEAPQLRAQVIDLTEPQLARIAEALRPPERALLSLNHLKPAGFSSLRPASSATSLSSWTQTIVDELSSEDLLVSVSQCSSQVSLPSRPRGRDFLFSLHALHAHGALPPLTSGRGAGSLLWRRGLWKARPTPGEIQHEAGCCSAAVGQQRAIYKLESKSGNDKTHKKNDIALITGNPLPGQHSGGPHQDTACHRRAGRPGSSDRARLDGHSAARV